MAWRIKALVAFASVCGIASGADVRHGHVWKSGDGALVVDDSGLRWSEAKKPKHDRAWTWQEIQQLELRPDSIRVLTYEDSRWKGGRDREYLLKPLAPGFAESALPALRKGLGPKLVDALPSAATVTAVWEVPVKLHYRLGGSEGMLRFEGREVRYVSKEKGESRTWPLAGIELVSSDGPYDLALSTAERAGFARGPREFRFQLKTPLSRENYQRLWSEINQTHGLRPLAATIRENESK